MRRRTFVSALGAGLALPLLVRAQQRSDPKIGFLHPGEMPLADLRIGAFLDGLRAGRGQGAPDVNILARTARGDPNLLPALTIELIDEKVDVILAVSPLAVRAARAGTTTIPIIGLDLESDPVAMGWVDSLARPGGNLTGIFLDLPELRAKCLELLSEAVSGLTRVGVFWDPATGALQREGAAAAAAQLGLEPQVIEFDNVSALEPSFRSAASSAVGGLLLLSSPVFGVHTRMIADLSVRYRLPTITLFPEFAQDGGMLAYGPDLQGLYRQAGLMAAQILRGVGPPSLPLQRPTLL